MSKMLLPRKRHKPNYAGIDSMIEELRPQIRKTINSLVMGYRLSDNNLSIAQENIELLLDSFTYKTGISPNNYKVVAGVWCYISDLYLNSLDGEFSKLLDESLTEGHEFDDLKFSVAYINRVESDSMIDELIKSKNVFFDGEANYGKEKNNLK